MQHVHTDCIMKTDDYVMKANNGNMPRTLVQHRKKHYENLLRTHVQHRLAVIVTSEDKHLQHPKKFKLWDIRTSA
jgi:hypothetical protein